MKKELLLSVTKKDFNVQTFRSGGKGGQNQNKVESGVRIVHPKSGAVGESREERSQNQNKKIAFRRLTNSDKFKKWLKMESSIIAGTMKSKEQLLKEVEDLVVDRHLKVEIMIGNKWGILIND